MTLMSMVMQWFLFCNISQPCWKIQVHPPMLSSKQMELCVLSQSVWMTLQGITQHLHNSVYHQWCFSSKDRQDLCGNWKLGGLKEAFQMMLLWHSCGNTRITSFSQGRHLMFIPMIKHFKETCHSITSPSKDLWKTFDEEHSHTIPSSQRPLNHWTWREHVNKKTHLLCVFILNSSICPTSYQHVGHCKDCQMRFLSFILIPGFSRVATCCLCLDDKSPWRESPYLEKCLSD